jgi:hypothetical protein
MMLAYLWHKKPSTTSTKEFSMKLPIQRTVIAALLLGLIGTLAGCATESALPAGPSSSAFLTPAEADRLVFMREEEKLARDVYEDLAGYWSGREDGAAVASILGRIAPSEQRHMDRLKALLDGFGLSDPVDPAETRGLFRDPDLAGLYAELTTRGRTGAAEALRVGSLIEEKDLADLQAALEAAAQDSIRTAYQALACGSRNHLRAFAGQLAAIEGGYQAQLLPPATVAAILASGSERCGW